MKRLIALFLLAGTVTVLFNSCQKETSSETGNDPSEGSLQGSPGDCLPKTVTGVYVEGTALDPATNQILVDVAVTKTGSYTIYSDTVNGVYFRGTGVFAALGNTAVTLKGAGTPLGAGTFNFNIIYAEGDTCTLSIPFLPTGAGGPAAFTFVSTGGNCSVASQTGTYTAGTAITAASVTLNVNVTTIGTYNITTTAVNGITFSSGPLAFSSTGNQTVVLNASGTPGTAGPANFTVTQGASTCTFSITVQPAATGPATFTFVSTGGNCSVTNQTGTYTAGAAASGTITLSVNVTVAGSYNITSTTVNGVTFSSGAQTFAATGNQTVVLTASGTPTAQGSHTYAVTQGASTCNFAITVQPAAGGPATFTFVSTGGNCSVTNQTGTYTAGTVAAGTITLSVNVTVAGTYSITSTTVNGVTFSSGSQTFAATGNQTVVLTASGTPTAQGTHTYAVTQGASTCNFSINVQPAATGAAVYTLDCMSASADGVYAKNLAFITTPTPSNTITFDVTVTTPGTYTITTGTVSGMTFSATGTFASAGPTTVTLVGTGTPTVAGQVNLTVTGGTAPCGIQLDILQSTGTWSFTQGSTTYSGVFLDSDFDDTSVPGLVIFGMYGLSAYGHYIELYLADITPPTGPVFNNGENYSCAPPFTGAANAGVFYFEDPNGNALYYADPDPNNPATNSLLLKVTTHTPATKTFVGTFSGNAIDNATGTLKPITNGNFTVTYQ